MSLSETDDPIEMIRHSGADPQVLGRIWEHYRDRLRRVVRLRLDHRLQGRADPSDVLQEAFLDFQARAAVQDVLDHVPTTHAEKLASLMTLNFQEFDDVSLLAA